MRRGERRARLCVLGGRVKVRLGHPETKPETQQKFLDLAQGLAAKALDHEQIAFRFEDKLAEGLNTGFLQAVLSYHPEFDVFDSDFEDFDVKKSFRLDRRTRRHDVLDWRALECLNESGEFSILEGLHDLEEHRHVAQGAFVGENVPHCRMREGGETHECLELLTIVHASFRGHDSPPNWIVEQFKSPHLVVRDDTTSFSSFCQSPGSHSNSKQ